MCTSEQTGGRDGTGAAEVSLADFRAELDVFSGPLDLLLYLIKREEVEVLEIPISRITDQYLQVLRTLQFFNVNLAAEFTVMAASLMEIKSRSLLPESRPEEEEEEDPRSDLVRRLLQYKCFKDAASLLAQRAACELRKHGRCSIAPVPEGPAPEPVFLLREVDVWDLVTAYARLRQQTQMPQAAQILYSDVPMRVYMEEILEALRASGGSMDFVDFFRKDRSRERIIGIFLALLELTRRRRVTAKQADGAHITLSLNTPEDGAPEGD